jgi:hypothetical protein
MASMKRKKTSILDDLLEAPQQEATDAKRRRWKADVLDPPLQEDLPRDSLETTALTAPHSSSEAPSFKAPGSKPSKRQDPLTLDSDSSDSECVVSMEINFEHQDDSAPRKDLAEDESVQQLPTLEEELEDLIDEENDLQIGSESACILEESHPRCSHEDFELQEEEGGGIVAEDPPGTAGPAKEKAMTDMQDSVAAPALECQKCSKKFSSARGLSVHLQKSQICQEKSEEGMGKGAEERERAEGDIEVICLLDEESQQALPSHLPSGPEVRKILWSKGDLSSLRRRIERAKKKAYNNEGDIKAHIATEFSRLSIEAIGTSIYLFDKKDFQSRSLYELNQFLHVLKVMINNEALFLDAYDKMKKDCEAKLTSAVAASLSYVKNKAGGFPRGSSSSKHLRSLFRPILRFLKPPEIEKTLVKIVSDFADALKNEEEVQNFLKLLEETGESAKNFPSRQPLVTHVSEDIYPFWREEIRRMMT